MLADLLVPVAFFAPVWVPALFAGLWTLGAAAVQERRAARKLPRMRARKR